MTERKDNFDAFVDKYRDVLVSMYEAGGKQDDWSVLVAKLVRMTNHRNEEGEDFYPGIPTDFDYEQCAEDIRELL